MQNRVRGLGRAPQFVVDYSVIHSGFLVLIIATSVLDVETTVCMSVKCSDDSRI